MEGMNVNIKYYLLYTIAYGIVLLLGEAIYRLLKRGPSWSRSFAHLVAGLITLPFAWLFTSHWWVLALCLQSCLVLLLTQSLKWLPSHHRIAGKSAGSYLFFVSVYLCFIAFSYSGRKELFVVPMLVLTFSDVAAAQLGRSFGKRTIQKKNSVNGTGKTIVGSTAFFITALLILFFSYYYYMAWSLAGSISVTVLIALISTTVEAYSPHGTDNFFIPLIVLTFMNISFIL
jgi:phytol kinase